MTTFVYKLTIEFGGSSHEYKQCANNAKSLETLGGYRHESLPHDFSPHAAKAKAAKITCACSNYLEY
jgi:hypothetical protein